VRAFIKDLPFPTWMAICMGVTLLLAVVALTAGWFFKQDERHRSASSPALASTSGSSAGTGGLRRPPGGNVALEGARLVFRSRYLLAIAAILGLYEIVSTVMDFQFTATVEHYLSGRELGAHFSTVYTITNITSLTIQLLGTTLVLRWCRMTVALLVTPLIMLGASGLFLALPILWCGSLLNTADNAFNYSINQSAKEALYTVTTPDEKYKAKAFIDMFVQRAAKVVAVGVSLCITLIFTDFSSIRWLSLFVVLLMVVWVMAARYAGRRFEATRSGASLPTTAPGPIETAGSPS
jgi:ATP:ADP antiporter, AAA family